ncbi:hypothetical protein SORBI_3001G274025 [Sorghum bicolor]|uniref:Delta kafirin-2 n=1 Tax=Sorghum bicolor TaxID=4558 RepID=C5WPV0_SORBI|nr:delta kafirin-2 [Sorghum bicolor]OQU92005.1 hypothetical protein SORBI_3001G274025 [Sorghum bicolor]
MASQTTKMLALVAALLALSTIATATANCLQNIPHVMGMTVMDPCMQSCMMQQPLAMVMMGMTAMDPCMQSCMMQQPLAMVISSPSLMMRMNSMVSCVQSCMTQQAFSIGGSSLSKMVMQPQPFSMMQQQCCMQPMMMQGLMSPPCHCGAMCQLMMHLQQMQMTLQLPSMYSTTAMPTLVAYGQKPFPCCAF